MLAVALYCGRQAGLLLRSIRTHREDVMKPTWSLGLTVLLLVACARPVAAEWGYQPEVKLLPPRPELQWNLWAGEYHFAYHNVSDFALDEDGLANPVGQWAEHRVRLSPAFAWGRFGARIELDLVEGQVLGDHEDLYPAGSRLDRRAEDHGRGFHGFLLREAYAQAITPIGLVRVGQMTSSYGLGVLANTGIEDDERFGVRRYGDVVDRALLALKPFRPLTGANKWGDYLTVVASGDMVYRDENADFRDGDRAWQANGGLFWSHPRYTNGAIFTFRTQEDHDGDTLEAFVLNLNGQNEYALTTMAGTGDEVGRQVPDLALSLDYEAIWLQGHTDRFQQAGTEEGLELDSFGAVGRLNLALHSVGLEAELEVGYASGDNNAHDDTSHSFFFDPDYNVGLVFFDEMLPHITARAAEIASDPSNVAVPAKGLDLVSSQERVTNVLYYFPQARWTWEPATHYIEDVKVLLGALLLTTPARFTHSYYTFRNGGSAANHLGRSVDSNFLGTELLAGVRTTLEIWPEHLGLTLHLDQSYFLPGNALADPAGNLPDGVWKILTAAALHWR